MISSCLKIQVGNSPSIITSFTGANLDYAVESVGNLDDLIVFAHLFNFFVGRSEWIYTMPNVVSTGTPTPVLFGEILDVQTSGHPDSLSLSCFTEQTLKNLFASEVPLNSDGIIMTPVEWRALIQSTSLENLTEVLRKHSLNSDGEIIPERTTFKVMRCTSADMLTLPPRHSDDPSYTDAFDLVKARLANNVGVLDSNGLAPAIYHADGDYIEFTADCAVGLNLSIPDSNPPPIILT